MLSAVIVVLRETLEAAFFISLSLIYGELTRFGKSWLFYTLVAATILAMILAYEMPNISDWFEGIGQEIVFSIMLLIIAINITLLNFITQMKVHIDSLSLSFDYAIIITMSVALITAVSLEASEIIIYMQSAGQRPGGMSGTVVGGLLGAGIGLSIGVICFYSLGAFEQKFNLVYFLLALISAGMVAQAFAFLIQAGIIDAGLPIWSSADIIAENSMLGQLLYALIGYESTPTAIQAIMYSLTIAIALLSMFSIRVYSHLKNKKV